MPRFAILGNPSSRRVTSFTRAAHGAGLDDPLVVSWLDLADDAERALAGLPDAPLWVRIESFGEDFEVERALLRRGSHRAPAGSVVLDLAQIAALRPDHGRIVAPRQAHEGFLAVLDDVDRVLTRRRAWRLMTPTWAIREMFDKGATSARLAALGVPVPRSRNGAPSAGALREALRAEGAMRVWVKLRCGSSASCLALWILSATETLITTMEAARGGYYNSKRVRRYGRRDDIDRAVGFLLGEGAHIEDDVPKATIKDRWVDARVLVIGGEPRFVVVRASRYPITNLHLGAARADPDELVRRCAPGAFEAALESSRVVARAYGALHVGVDVAILKDFSSHRILEANAFGDLLHGVTKDGMDPYAWEIRELLTRW
jgi:hypothetical protein